MRVVILCVLLLATIAACAPAAPSPAEAVCAADLSAIAHLLAKSYAVCDPTVRSDNVTTLGACIHPSPYDVTDTIPSDRITVFPTPPLDRDNAGVRIFAEGVALLCVRGHGSTPILCYADFPRDVLNPDFANNSSASPDSIMVYLDTSTKVVGKYDGDNPAARGGGVFPIRLLNITCHKMPTFTD